MGSGWACVLECELQGVLHWPAAEGRVQTDPLLLWRVKMQWRRPGAQEQIQPHILLLLGVEKEEQGMEGEEGRGWGLK